MAALWDAAGAFHAEPANSKPGDKPYCIVIPPPNVTASLHMGHALNNTLQDILIRYHRMLGENTLWMPGTDHAGIATQTVVDKRLQAEHKPAIQHYKNLESEGKGGRNLFIKKVQSWKDEYEAQITNQLKAMGCSCDWSRQRFTMDDICARAVREAFFRLFKDGLIYRGKRLVNWDPATQTALADDEVEMHDIDGFFWYLRYPLADGSGHVTVATTRPETMLGDTAVAVNPKDPRAAELRGKKVRLPIVNRIIPIVEDDYVVLPDPQGDEKSRYSSGFLKVTPAHDPNDYDIGQRFNLPMINIMAPDGTISDQYGWPLEDFSQSDAEFVLGLDRYEAREAIVDWFRQNGLLEDVKPYRHAVGHSYRSHATIEPYLSDQWYVKVTDDRLSGAALRAMSEDQSSSAATGHDSNQNWQGQLRFTPARYANTFRGWHENIRDWCISRQLWWGHRIPVWSIEGKPSKLDPLAREGRIAIQQFGKSCYVCVRDESDKDLVELLDRLGFVRDPDVLDTWFSSGLWPISTMGWPDEEGNDVLQTWNPSNVLCTAREIITLWVSRMVMFNLYLRNCLPFTDVFIHAMIQDGQGRKMSKSLGNGVDPLDIIHSHGADAMRFTLTSMTTQTQDVRLPVKENLQSGRNTSSKFDIGRNFANKLWNAARFAMGNLTSDDTSQGNYELADRWIISRLATILRDTNEALARYEFSQYAQGLYDFFWRDFCDWYIEAVKPTVRDNPSQQRVLATCLDVALRLLHPAMPFVTEKLWQQLNEVAPRRGVDGVSIPASELLLHATWPKVDYSLINKQVESDFVTIQTWSAAIREIRQSHQIPPREAIQFISEPNDDKTGKIKPHARYFEIFANATFSNDISGSTRIGTAQVETQTLVVFRQVGDVDHEAERDRLTKRLDEVRKNIATLRGRLNNKGYTEKAPAHLVQQTRDQLASAEKEADALQSQIAAIE